MTTKEIEQELIRLEAYFRTGLEAATGLRKKLGVSTPGPEKGLSPSQQAKLIAKRMQSSIKKQAIASK